MERYSRKIATVLILLLLLLSGLSACKSQIVPAESPPEELRIVPAPIPAANFYEPVESVGESYDVPEKPALTALDLPSPPSKPSGKPGVADAPVTGAKPDLETASPEIEDIAAPPPVSTPPPPADSPTPHTTNTGPPAPRSDDASVASAPVETPAATVTAATVTNNATESPSPPSSPDLSALASEVIRLTNAEREKAGLSPLTTTSLLTQTASLRASEIIQYFSHNRPDGRSCFTAFDEYGVPYNMAGENLGRGQLSAAEIVADWMGSPGHRDNILNGGFVHIGVGVAIDSGGLLYWVQSFSD